MACSSRHRAGVHRKRHTVMRTARLEVLDQSSASRTLIVALAEAVGEAARPHDRRPDDGHRASKQLCARCWARRWRLVEIADIGHEITARTRRRQSVSIRRARFRDPHPAISFAATRGEGFSPNTS